MFALFSGLAQWACSKTHAFVPILGLDAAGKTTLLEQMKSMYIKGRQKADLDRIPPTIGMNVGKMDILSTSVTFQDLGGHMRDIWKQYYAEASGAVVVVDGADHDRLREAQCIAREVLASPDLAGVPLLVLANKNDLVGAVDVHSLAAAILPTAASAPAAAAAATGAGRGGGSDTATFTVGGREVIVASISALSCQGVQGAVEAFVPHVRALAATRAAAGKPGS